MAQYFARIAGKTAQLATLVLAVTLATFWLSSLIPGDFYTGRALDPTVRRETLERLRSIQGLDLPMHVQYLRWLRRAARLDLGYSLYYQAPVASVAAHALARTLWIGVPALLFGILLGSLLGSLHALFCGRMPGAVLDLFSAIALSLPTVLLGLLALLLAAHTRWFPLGGMNDPGIVGSGSREWLVDRLHHLALPVACLSIPIAAYVERIQLAACLQTLQQQIVRAARARGLRGLRLLINHLLRPSLNPVLSVLGPLFGAALSGSLVIEVIFAWPGLGQVTYEALFNRDVFLLVGCVITTSLLLVVGNTDADLLGMLLDPRMRASQDNPT